MNKSPVVLITGSSRGFGLLASKTLALKGYTVFATMRDPAGRNAAARDQLLEQGKGQKLHIIDLDVADDRSVDQAVAEIIQAGGHIDVLINNAGFSIGGFTEAMTLEQAHRLFETNFFGVVRMNRAVAPHMRRRGKGLIIHVTSTSGRSVVPGMGIYAATKFATEALAEVYRYELCPFGIDSVILEPGPYATEVFVKKELPGDWERLKDYEKLWPKMSEIFETMEARCENPQEVADAIVRIIETPTGERPLRQIIGPSVPRLHDLNDISMRVQREILEYLGIGGWLAIPPSADRETTLRFGWGGGRKPGK